MDLGLTIRPVTEQEQLFILQYFIMTIKIHSVYSDYTLNDLRIRKSRRIGIYIRK